MKLPHLADPQRYQGLYVYDFGQWSAVGYTAEEIAILLEDPRHRGGKVYRIHGASPNGSMELYAVSAERFGLESGMLFFRADLESARADFRQLCQTANATPPPCRASVRLADRGQQIERTRFAVALAYPAEYDPDIARWLSTAGYMGGDTVEGGISCTTGFLSEPNTILDQRQLWNEETTSSRSRQEVLSSIRTAIQR